LGLLCTVLFFYRRSGHWLDLLYALQQHLFEFCRYARHYRHFYQRIFVDSYWSQLFSHYPHHARARLDLVPLALLSGLYGTSIISFSQPRLSPSPFRSLSWKRVFHLGFSIPLSWRSDSLPASLLVLFAPVVYIMSYRDGVVSELIATFARKPVFGYKFVAGSSIAIAVLGFSSGASYVRERSATYTALTFSFLSYLVAIPSAVKVFN